MGAPVWVRASALVVGLLMSGESFGQGADASRQGEVMLGAAARGDVATINRVMIGGGTVNVRDEMQQTPLLLAVQGNHLEAFNVLLAEGGDINAQAHNKDTPWLLAGALGRTEMIRAMIPRGPDLSIRNRYGGNALIPACERAHVETVKLLLTTKIDVDHVNNLGWTCLLEIVLLGDGGPRHQQVARMVLDAGANPNLADNKGVTPLAHAKSRGQKEIAAMIAAKGGK